MNGTFIAALVLLGIAGAIALLAFLVPKEKHVVTRDQYNKIKNERTVQARANARKLAFLPLVLGVFLVLWSSWTRVDTNKIGIFTSMGKPYDATDNGFTFQRPWAEKTEFDASRQFLRFCNDGNNEEDADKKLYRKISIKIDGNAQADICGTVAWQMKATTVEEKRNAIQLFKDYRTFERMTNNLVYANLKVAVASALANLNPLVAEKNMSVAQINERVLSELRKELTGSVVIQAADIQVPDYDKDTDTAIAADLAQKAKTSLEKERKLTNEAAAAANAAIVNSIQDPKVLINRCLDIAKELGYNPGLCMMGNNDGVIVNGDVLNKKQ